ncbi:hypothetical protein VFPPC_03704 [Pochonia chlamydosporia 170]|uniref:Uncharacterized protein n=1 Tax=Pochonia chlamydosporia 170 TaxID=1380566 RepID=A0A179G2G9_METCM|nr:hypothetical protein VFPPC_03704 [Pochonia chlamydosporia 170]OAQ71399.1 hypothetical protein VFPPC_03704 [Pochonia chlamydosporia 170]
MPTYLCHGFRWYRRNIRIFVILNNLDDCAPDWIVGRDTAALLLSQLAESYDFIPRLENEDGTVTRPDSDTTTPTQEKRLQIYDDDLAMPTSKLSPAEDNVLVHQWSPVKLLEEYDMNEMEHAARPYAYLADHVIRVDLGADILAEMAQYEKTMKERNASWLERLREQVQPEEQLRWYVVVCDDGDREAPEEDVHAYDEPVPTETIAPPRTQTRVMDERNNRPSSGNALRITSQKKTSEAPLPAFLEQDPFKSEGQPAPRLKRKLSIRRLFSKKDS